MSSQVECVAFLQSHVLPAPVEEARDTGRGVVRAWSADDAYAS